MFLPKVNLGEIDRLNSLSKGEDEHRARYGLTRLSDMSKDEYRDIHLSDEKMVKAPHMYGKSWNQYKDWKKHSHRDNSDKENGPNRDINIIMRKKRAVLPMKFDW